MDFSRNWIAEYVDLPDDVGEVADRLTSAGLAVEGIEAKGDDHLLDIDVTTNRPDCMNHLGLAREAAALFGVDLRPPASETETCETEARGVEVKAERAEDVASLEIDDFTLCPRYSALVIRGVKVGPSPDWLRQRLESIGSRSINNIVDITNFVLWETGQPMHAYDLHRIGGAAIKVRQARSGEVLKTLDGQERKLDPSILIIADADQPIGLAGIMGGYDSEVTDDSVDVLLEAAHFDPDTVRQSAKKLGMHTDASHRFERGADPEASLWALRRAAGLMAELAGGEVLAGEINSHRLREEWPPRVEISVERLEAFGGIEIGNTRATEILHRLGFCVEGDGDRLLVTVPSWRYYDFEQAHAQDVYEEVLRIHGLDPIPATLPAIAGVDPGAAGLAQIRRRRAQDTLAASGLVEAINFAFHARQADDAYPTLYEGLEAMELANPLSDLYSVMRRSLLPNLVETARYNQRRSASSVRVFEIGHIFGADGVDGRVEMETLAMVMGGEIGTPWERSKAIDFYDLKGVVETVAVELGQHLTFHAGERRLLVPGTVAEIRLVGASEADGNEGDVIGYLGQLDEESVYPLYVAEIALDLLGDPTLSLQTQTPSRFPGIAVDLTFTHALSTPWREIESAIADAKIEDLRHFSLHDRYLGEGVPEGGVNTTITFLYNSENRSLTQEEVNERHSALSRELQSRFGFDGEQA